MLLNAVGSEKVSHLLISFKQYPCSYTSPVERTFLDFGGGCLVPPPGPAAGRRTGGPLETTGPPPPPTMGRCRWRSGLGGPLLGDEEEGRAENCRPASRGFRGGGGLEEEEEDGRAAAPAVRPGGRGREARPGGRGSLAMEETGPMETPLPKGRTPPPPGEAKEGLAPDEMGCRLKAPLLLRMLPLALPLPVAAGLGAGATPLFPPPLPTGGWIFESTTMYFWSFDAENDSVVPGLTLSATLRGTLSKTCLALAPL